MKARLETPVRAATGQQFGTDGYPTEFIADVRPDEDYKLSVEVTSMSGELLELCHEYIPLEDGDVIELVVIAASDECSIAYIAEAF